MPAWPAYAKILRDGFGFEREAAGLRTDVESGPAKQTRTKSRAMVQVPVRVLLRSQADYLAFLAWHRTDIQAGFAWFDWTHPVTGATTQARIVGGKLGREEPTAGLQRWEIPTTLEYWDA